MRALDEDDTMFSRRISSKSGFHYPTRAALHTATKAQVLFSATALGLHSRTISNAAFQGRTISNSAFQRQTASDSVPSSLLSTPSTNNFPLAAALDGIAITQTEAVPAPPDVESLAPVIRNASAWNPPWDVFPLAVFRSSDRMHIDIHRDWDDAILLHELARVYEMSRKWYGRYFAFTDIW